MAIYALFSPEGALLDELVECFESLLPLEPSDPLEPESDFEEDDEDVDEEPFFASVE